MKPFLKIILIIIAIILVIGLGYWIWTTYINPPLTIGNPITDSSNGGSIPGLPPINSHEVFDYWIANNGDQYLVGLNGEVYKVAADGTEEKVSSQTIDNLRSIAASPDGTLALISFGVSPETFTIFDTKTNTWKPLPTGTTAADWHPQASNQLLIIKNGVLQTMSVADLKTKTVMNLAAQDVKLDWISTNIAYLSEKPSAAVPTNIWRVDIAKKTIQPVTANENNALLQWSENKSLAIKSTDDDTVLINNTYKMLAALQFRTFASKCLITTKELVCAVPQNNVQSDAYLKGSVAPNDQLIRIPFIGAINNQINDLQTTLPLPITNLDAIRLKTDGQKLFFINRHDNKLYSIAL